MVNENLEKKPKIFNFRAKYHVGWDSRGTYSDVDLECKVGGVSSSSTIYFSGIVHPYVGALESRKMLATPLKNYAKADEKDIAESTKEVILKIWQRYGIVYSPQDQICFPEEGKKIGSNGVCDDGSKYTGYGFSLEDLDLSPHTKTIESTVKEVSKQIGRRNSR
jgi:hypothetical protein